MDTPGRMDTQANDTLDIAENPLVAPSPLQDQAVPFDRVEVQHYLPALDHTIAEAKARIEAILANPAAPDIENTIVALEQAGQDVDRVSSVFYNQLSAQTSDELQALAADFGAKSANFSSDVSLDPRVFARVRAVWDARDSLGLKGEKARLLDDTYTGFVRNGALLSDNEKGELRAIDEALAKLTPDFQHNVLKATNAFTLWVEDEADLAGLPEGAVKAAKLAAEERDRPEAWLITLDAPSYVPFMTYAENRGLREQLWRAFNARAFGGEFDNQPLVKEIASLRFRRAKLLGYPSHAAFVLEKRMAETPDAVHAFLDRLLAASKPAAERDLAEIQAHARTLGGPDPLQPWDVGHYAEKLKQHRFAFDEEALRPYFPLGRVIDGVFEHCRRLYGLVFRPSDAYPVWHPDVKAYEVYDEAEDRYVGLFYADFFPRSSKRNGAWMTTYRDQGLYHDGVKRPHVAIVCNFTKPTADRPSLLSYDEVRTFFHEMGHALHGLLSRCTYRSLGGTNVYWDFVELPSQIFENWVQQKDGLDLFAGHYQTGEKLPADLVEKIRESARFMAGWQSLRQTSFAQLDMAWHDGDPTAIASVPEFERSATARAQVLPPIPEANSSSGFSHIFGGGYSAGYYSYKWAEVLDADAFELFQEKGLFDPATARSFKENVLERGGTEHPMELYKRFRGREPDQDALLRRDGLM
jgi:peptidyl-dipeptidase Dcp